MTDDVSPRSRTLRVALREFLWITFYSVLSVAMTWPLARLLDRALSDPGDPLLNIWILHWDWYATFSAAPLWHANIYHPAQWSLAFSENLYGIALLTFPLRFAGVDPITTYNLAMLGGFMLSAYGMHVFARTMLSDLAPRWSIEIAALVAGVFYGFVPYRFDHLPHLQHIWSGWIPLLLAALVPLLRSRSFGSAIPFVLAYVMNGLSNVHWLLFSAVTVPVIVFVILVLRDQLFDRKLWIRFGVAFVIANLLLLPLLIPYKIAAEEYGMRRGITETTVYSATLADWTVGVERSSAWGDRNADIRKSERSLFPGALVLLLSAAALVGRSAPEAHAETPSVQPSERPVRWLDWLLFASGIAAIIGAIHASGEAPSRGSLRIQWIPVAIFFGAMLVRFWRRMPSWLQTDAPTLREWVARKERPFALWIGLTLVLLGVVGSLGLHGPLHSLLYAMAEPFRSLRVPARWAMIAYAGLGLTSAVGTMVVARWVPGRGRFFAAGLLPLLMIAELWSAPVFWFIVTDPRPAVHEWLRDAPVSGAILELPIDPSAEYRHVMWSTIHNRPILNGFSGFETDLHAELVRLFGGVTIPPQAIDLVESNGASTVVVHNDDRQAPPVLREWVQTQIAAGRLRFLTRHPHGRGHDYVFAVPRNEPNLSRLTQASVEDRQALQTFLASNEITRIDATFGILDWPQQNLEIVGDLNASGWALSPHGVREVNLLFQNAAVRVPTESFADPGLGRLYPWYDVERPRFIAKLENRPDGVQQETDVIVEIVDGRGEVTWLPQRPFRWLRQKPIEPVRIEHWNEEALGELIARLGHDSSRADAVLSERETIEDLVIAQLPAVAALDDDAFVRSLYEIVLAREPDEPGVRRYVEKLRGGSSRERIARTFLASDEFRARYSAR